jgi:hypothetical protein
VIARRMIGIGLCCHFRRTWCVNTSGDLSYALALVFWIRFAEQEQRLSNVRSSELPALGSRHIRCRTFASDTKIDWSPDPDELETIAAAVAECAIDELERDGIIDDPQPNLIQETPRMTALRTLPPDALKLLLRNSISALPLHKTLVLLDAIQHALKYQSHMRLALARALVSTISNLHFGPEVGVGPPKKDSPVVSTWLGRVLQIAHRLTKPAKAAWR